MYIYAPTPSPSIPRHPRHFWQGGATALIRAALSGHEAVVRLLLESKASIDAADQVVTRN